MIHPARHIGMLQSINKRNKNKIKTLQFERRILERKIKYYRKRIMILNNDIKYKKTFNYPNKTIKRRQKQWKTTKTTGTVDANS